jgi:hypothetical protein
MVGDYCQRHVFQVTFLICSTGSHLLSSSALCARIDLDIERLPSEQGWSYEGTTPESAMFAVSAGALRMDSRGLADPRGRYTFYDILDPNRPFSLDFRLRLIDADNFPVYDWVFYLGAIGPTFWTEVLWHTAEGAGVSFAGAMVEVNPGNTHAVGTNVDRAFHDYRMTAVPGGPLRFFVDGSLIALGETPDMSGANLLFLEAPERRAVLSKFNASLSINRSRNPPHSRCSCLQCWVCSPTTSEICFIVA